MGSKRNLVRFLAMLLVLTVLIAMPLVAKMPSDIVLSRTSFALEPFRFNLRVSKYACPLRRKAQCNLYAFNANDHNAMPCLAAA